MNLSRLPAAAAVLALAALVAAGCSSASSQPPPLPPPYTLTLGSHSCTISPDGSSVTVRLPGEGARLGLSVILVEAYGYRGGPSEWHTTISIPHGIVPPPGSP